MQYLNARDFCKLYKGIAYFEISMLRVTIYLLQFALLLLSVISSPDCPEVCQQITCTVGILNCPSGGLHRIPDKLPPQTTKVLLTNQKFDSSQLSGLNFSNYDAFNIDKLTILNCSIVTIEVETFSRLQKLKTLDLSKNKIEEIKPKTFNGMSLNFLRLDENRNIRLKKHSFLGLNLKILSLIDCNLSDLRFEGFSDIAGSLERLILTQNNLRIIDSRFMTMFGDLKDLELNNNPLDCSCDMKWLSKALLYRKGKNPDATDNDKKYDGSRARCATPQKLSNRMIFDLKDADFVCGLPSLIELDLYIIANDLAKLSCISSSDHGALVMWKYLHDNRDQVIYDSQTLTFNSTISIQKKEVVDTYICVAQNENGNTTAEIRIKWPTVQSPIGDNRTTGKEIEKGSPEEGDFLFRRQFTLLEMMGGVVGTFTGTLLLFILIYRCFIQKYRKESRKKKLYETVFYSDSQTYDIPHHTPYYPVHTTYQSTPAQYLDFKNPQIVNNRQIL